MELEFKSLLGENLEVSGSVGYVDAKYTSLKAGTLLSKSFLFQNTPKWSLSLTGEYTVPLDSGDSILFHVDWA